MWDVACPRSKKLERKINLRTKWKKKAYRIAETVGRDVAWKGSIWFRRRNKWARWYKRQIPRHPTKWPRNKSRCALIVRNDSKPSYETISSEENRETSTSTKYPRWPKQNKTKIRNVKSHKRASYLKWSLGKEVIEWAGDYSATKSL